MIRDFTERAKNELFEQMDMVRSDRLWEGVVDCVSDWGYNLQSWLGSLSIGWYLDNINLYHQKLLDMNNSVKAGIDKVFTDVESIDRKYGNLLTLLEQEIDKCQQYTHNMALIINPDSRWLTTEACIALKTQIQHTGINALMEELRADVAGRHTNVNYMDKEKMQEYVQMYEILHPEDGEKLDHIFESDQVLTDDDKRKIKYIAYTAEEPYRTVYFKYLDQYEIGTIGEEDGACYKPATNMIYFKDEKTAFSQDARGPYTTWFHESGHATDSNAEEGSDFYCYNYKIYLEAFGGEVTLQEVIYDDVYQNVRETIEYYAREVEELSRVEMILDTFRYGEDESQLTEAEMQIRKSVIEYYDDDLNGVVNEAACDVYGGVTNLEIGRVPGGYGHRPGMKDESGDWLSDEEYQEAVDAYRYWYDEEGNATFAQSKELVAEYFSYHMTGNVAALESLEEHFPQAIQVLDQMFIDMAGEN